MRIISTAPHIRSRRTTKCIMLDVLIALLPAAAAGIASLSNINTNPNAIMRRKRFFPVCSLISDTP